MNSLNIRDMTREQIIHALEHALNIAKQLTTQPRCAWCEEMDTQTNYCEYWQQEVPLEAQADGCNHFSPLVPF